MKLAELLPRTAGARLVGDAATEVLGITHDSRRVAPGFVFAAFPGHLHHGLEFLADAAARGAAAVLSDRPPAASDKLPWIISSRPRADAAALAWALAGDPQRRLQLLAVTGTNGKSTTAHLIRLILQAHGRRTAFVGTLGMWLPDGRLLPSARTTPEATELAVWLRDLVAAGGDAVVLEASSHALLLDRLAGLHVDVAVWTNLSQDHLDYHRDMASYFAAKRRLFDHHLAADGRRVLPVDDPWASRLLDEPRAGDLAWGLGRGVVHASGLECGLEGSRFTLHVQQAEAPVSLPLIGEHNVANALAAAAAAHACDVDVGTIAAALAAATPLCGRLERVCPELSFPVFVDYAHTPDGLRAVVSALKQVAEGRRLIVVFGAGGDRDRGKRAPMGRAVGEGADVAVVTSDNPRGEDPRAIADAVAAGVREAGREPLLILDRRQAIARAIELADDAAVVLVAGKGHEATQTIGDQILPFSDQQVIRELIGGGRCG